MNNQTNKIVNLSHLILNKIISCLDDNIDIICFSLVCKRWYNDRDKYLIFNTDNINLYIPNNTDIYQNNKHFNLPSYHNIFMKSIQSKTDCSLLFSKKKQYRYDYHYDEVRELNSIPSNVSKIDYVAGDTEYIYRLLSESQSVTVLNGCCTLKYGLPKSIKSLKFNGDFNEPLVKGLLPNSLEVLEFSGPIKQEIPPGVLPDGLRTLILKHYEHEIRAGVLPNGLRKLILENYEYEIRPGVLPNSLRKLTLEPYNYEIPPGLLPNGLQRIYLIGYQYELQQGVLPSSIKNLFLASYDDPLNEHLNYSIDSTTLDENVEGRSCLPISWLLAISSLPNLQSLDIYYPKDSRHDTTIFNLNYLPPNLETLEISLHGKDRVLRGAIPTSLKIIRLGDCQFNIDEIFPETQQYHLEVLDYENSGILPIPSNVSIDILKVSGESSESTISLPSRVRSFKLNMEYLGLKEMITDFGGDDNTDQTCSLRKLRLPKFIDGLPIFKLPNTIESLDIGRNYLNDIVHLIPPTLNTLVFTNHFAIKLDIPETIKSITNIIYRFRNSNGTEYKNNVYVFVIPRDIRNKTAKILCVPTKDRSNRNKGSTRACSSRRSQTVPVVSSPDVAQTVLCSQTPLLVIEFLNASFQITI
ncbi:hypothetical protein PPL_10863 [Heterostelium album PN500]|uniref:F-box domain-containing protein n=1 Tax=Heterostelium pallidum (strain ATCC 26659 / Pp 5 / PN500) TaxID=670386 RepID=D3BS71_HETP5|nr:hypothetical protein PPL_10863 [Heterostelium album PN500]EFA75808.1 hypothetical protein PPL_10863 [Heterostelium album PN500]|eukprot:XP_020427942.1 hypothetical protein PPL_10863 [Heterostelium album PN500]